MDRKSLIHEIKVIDGDIFKTISNRYKSLNIDITPMHAKIIMTIYKAKEPLCQRDLESRMSCNKSTISAIISTMEKKGLLIRKNCEQDSRVNYLLLTDKGLEMVLFLKKDRKLTEDIMLDGITEDEYLMFNQVVAKIRKNLERI